MKSLNNLLFLLAICSIFTFVACSKDDDSPSEFITATIDGNAFDADLITAFAENSLGTEIVLASGTNASETFIIGLNIPTDSPVNQAQIIDEFDFAITFTDADNNVFATDGIIELSKLEKTDQLMEGTFSFTATNDQDSTNVHEITNGEFKLSY